MFFKNRFKHEGDHLYGMETRDLSTMKQIKKSGQIYQFEDRDNEISATLYRGGLVVDYPYYVGVRTAALVKDANKTAKFYNLTTPACRALDYAGFEILRQCASEDVLRYIPVGYLIEANRTGDLYDYLQSYYNQPRVDMSREADSLRKIECGGIFSDRIVRSAINREDETKEMVFAVESY